MLVRLADEYPELTGVVLFVLAALLVWRFFKWMDKTG